MSGRPADAPQFNVCPNASRPGLVLFAVGSGTDPYSITPALAEALADELLASAAAARRAGGDGRPADMSPVTCGDSKVSARTVAGRPPHVRADTGGS